MNDRPGPLVSAEWLSSHLHDPDLRIVHVSTERVAYDRHHLPGAVFSDLHVDLARAGRSPETGQAERDYLVPERWEVSAVLARWGAAAGTRIVFYDDEGQNRHAVRGYWLLRLYRFPAERVHVLDGGLPYWLAQGLPPTAQIVAPPVVAASEAQPLGDRDDSLVATADQVLGWSKESVAGVTRLLDVRTIDEYLGRDVRAARGGRIPGARHRFFADFVAEDGRLRPAADAVAALRGSGVNPAQLRATYCQGGVRAALGWFVLHELAGLSEVRSYAGSWEEWGNRMDVPVER